MVRSLAILALAASLGCGYPKIAMITGVATVGGLGVGAPLAHECTKREPGDCGITRDLTYVAVGAAAGALVGWWLYTQWRDGAEQQAKRKQAKAKGPLWRPVESERAAAETWILARAEPEPEPQVARRAWLVSLGGARSVYDLPVSALGARIVGDGVAATCALAKDEVHEMLEARCSHQGYIHGLDEHTILDEPCACDDTDDGRVVCDALATATCAEVDATWHVIGAGTSDDGQRSIASAAAEEDAEL